MTRMSTQVATKNTIVPYVGIDRIVETTGTLYKNNKRELGVTELASLLGCKVSNINNVTPTLGVMGLAQTKKRVVALTNEGMDFVQAYDADNMEKAKSIIQAGIKKSEALLFVKSLLDTRSEISGEELGRALSDRFHKNWKNVRTYRTIGNSCASILAFAGMGFHFNGILSAKPPSIRAESRFPAPEIGFNPILNLLRVLNNFERAKSTAIAERSNSDEQGISADLSVCVLLGLVTQNGSAYSITEIGRNLVDPTNDAPARARIFRQALLASPYSEVIYKVSDLHRPIDTAEIGEVLAFSLKREWSPASKEIYGKKMLTWLQGAELATPAERGTYEVRADRAEFAPIVSAEQVPKTDQTPDIARIFEIGRATGALETLLTRDAEVSFKEKVATLKLLLKQYDDMQLLLDALANNFDLARNSDNPSIFTHNLDFVRETIRGKLALGGNQAK